MRASTVALVRDSWARVVPIAPQAAELFYANLFARDPSLTHLFRGDMRVQGQRLMAMIGTAVGRLHEPDTLLPMLRGLGQRHDGYGVQPHHYDTVGSALLQTLEQGLGEAFSPAVRAAWVEVYGVLAAAMQPVDAAVAAA